MQEEFYQSSSLSKDKLNALMTRNDHLGLLRFGIQYSLLWGAAAWIVGTVEMGLHWSLTLGGMLVFALTTLSMFAIVHETGHLTAFKTRWLNQAVCWLASLPIFYTPSGFRALHFEHHRQTHIPGKDPEISMAAKPVPAVTSNPFMYLGFASGLPLLGYKVNMIILGALGSPKFIWTKFMYYVPETKRKAVSFESRLALLFHGSLFGLALQGFNGLWYVLGALGIGHVFLAGYTMAEHNGLSHEGHILERTRSVKANALLRWIFWNMPYHAEHHAYPAVPWHALDALHREMELELLHVESGYLHFHKRSFMP